MPPFKKQGSFDPQEHEAGKKAAEYCKLSLKALCKLALGMKDWCELHDEMERHLKKPSRRKLILVPRGHLKSSVVTIGWSIQEMLRNFDIRILVANAVWDNSRKFLRQIEKYLELSELKSWFGWFMSDHWNQDECTVRQRKMVLAAPTWATTGLEKEQTSQHYDLIIADDVVARENVMTPEQRQRVKLYYRDLLDLLEPDGTLVCVGTRWHMDDLYGDLLQDSSWDVLLKSCYKEDGSVIFPQKFSPNYLNQLRLAKGPVEFAAQYLNNAIDESAADFKASYVRFYDIIPQSLSFYLTVDPAISQRPGADYTAMVVCGMDETGRIFIVDRIRGRMTPMEIVERIFELMGKWKLSRMGLETRSFQLTLKYSLEVEMRKKTKFFSIDELGRGSQVTKEARIRRLQPFFEQGMIYIRKDMQDVVDELISFPRGRHDDLIDALSFQLDYLVPATACIQVVKSPFSYNSLVERARHGSLTPYQKFLEDLNDRSELQNILLTR